MSTLRPTTTETPQTFTEPLTLAEMQGFLGLPTLSPVDAVKDAEIEAFITGAREQAEILQGRDLVEKQYDLTLDAFPACEIELRDNLKSVDLFTYKDSDGVMHTLVENADFIVDTAKSPGSVQPVYNGEWPSDTLWPSSAVLVRFTVKPPEVPNLVKVGMKLLISAWFNNKLPFELGASAVQEYPYTVTACLSSGALVRPR